MEEFEDNYVPINKYKVFKKYLNTYFPEFANKTFYEMIKHFLDLEQRKARLSVTKN